MGDYKIKMNISVYNKNEPSEDVDVTFDTDLSEEDSISIDAVEKTFLNLNRKVLKEAISQHLEEVSKEKCQKHLENVGGLMEFNENKYRVDGEIGRFTFKTHSLYIDNKNVFDTAKDIFETLYSKEWYRTEGFNEIALDLVTDMSYRKAVKKLNRIRHEEEGTPLKTLANIVEIEGENIQSEMISKSKQILKENDFSTEATPLKCKNTVSYEQIKCKVALKEEVLETVINEYNLNKQPEFRIDISEKFNFYENTKKTTNISIDDVSVKKQKLKRPKDIEKTDVAKIHYNRNTIVHVENKDGKYYLNSSSTKNVMPILIAFLIHNKCLKSYLQFFVDGEQTLQNTVLASFRWFKSFGIILDWYHLIDKCKRELSSALNNTKFRNTTLTKIIHLLWFGKINDAIDLLRNLDKTYIKSEDNLVKLINYFERNRTFIPCYALRKNLGLRISSNKGEKANDLLVANRQKHQGMSWSKNGSISLTTVTAIHRNNEQSNWFSKKLLEFKLVA
jgi:hypothetical protein